MLNRLRKRWLFLTFLLFVYIVSYSVVRVEKLLVHRVAFITDQAGKKSYLHNISQGDFGIPLLTGNTIWRLSKISYYLYSPLRYVEKLFWKIYPRDYTFE